MIKNILGISVFITAIFSSTLSAEPYEGCYSITDDIDSAVPMRDEEGALRDKSSELKTSYINIFKKEHQYFAQGLLWGGNFHVCHITAPIEGDSEPLPLTLKDGKLIFTQLEPEYDTSCNLEILFTDKGLKIVDENYHCSKYVFYCGVRVGLNNTELPKSVNKCPEEE